MILSLEADTLNPWSTFTTFIYWFTKLLRLEGVFWDHLLHLLLKQGQLELADKDHLDTVVFIKQLKKSKPFHFAYIQWKAKVLEKVTDNFHLL